MEQYIILGVDPRRDDVTTWVNVGILPTTMEKAIEDVKDHYREQVNAYNRDEWYYDVYRFENGVMIHAETISPVFKGDDIECYLLKPKQ